ncbi:unnamed protein product [Strongylus vulgaris]|uniref:Platelet-derived growth factor (PDGF) family profile domain-containing protein n=1 Tax=Strongylus vulgaris TaxID=40348 RepID=A0A3P7K2D8_STRVU|nr:unnamed protein product [Strongylus vulgaris]
MRISAANFIKSSASRLRTMTVDDAPTTSNTMDVNTAEHLSLFGSIKQGNDTCQLQSVCVPIPLDNGDPQVVIYPKCYEVMQCVGSCCDSFERCHPHSIRKLERPVSPPESMAPQIVIEMLYVGNGRFMLNQTLNITMEEHTSCSCYDCGPNVINTHVPECPPGFVIGSDCKCQCANKGERHNCEGAECCEVVKPLPRDRLTLHELRDKIRRRQSGRRRVVVNRRHSIA